jgi:hypothetical protein
MKTSSMRAVLGSAILASVLAATGTSHSTPNAALRTSTVVDTLEADYAEVHHPNDDGARDMWTRRRFTLLVHGEALGPLGLGGVSAQYAFTRWLSASIGLGGNPRPQAAAMVRLRAPLDDHFGAGFALGASYGSPFHVCRDGCDPEPSRLSADAEVYVEGRASSGLVARLYGGVHKALRFEGAAGYAGAAVGWSF